MKLNKAQIWGIIICIVMIIGSFFVFFTTKPKMFYFLAGISMLIAGIPFLSKILMDLGREKDKEEMFLEFARSLVESVKVGTPISKSIVNMKNKNFGTLTPHIQKLANQIVLGIPVRKALDIFAYDINNSVISRSIALISEAEKAGGDIGTILESVAKSVSQIEDLKKEQKTAIYGLVVQGYIIFVIFIIIMLVTQFKIMPMTAGLGGAGESLNVGGGDLGGLLGGIGGSVVDMQKLSNSFLVLLIVQGFFAGLVIGVLSEDSLKAGLRHSFVLAFLSLLISLGANAFMS
jgi:flagellar protein FlaJ